MPIVGSPIMGWMTIPPILCFDHGTYGTLGYITTKFKPLELQVAFALIRIILWCLYLAWPVFFFIFFLVEHPKLAVWETSKKSSTVWMAFVEEVLRRLCLCWVVYGRLCLVQPGVSILGKNEDLGRFESRIRIGLEPARRWRVTLHEWSFSVWLHMCTSLMSARWKNYTIKRYRLLFYSLSKHAHQRQQTICHSPDIASLCKPSVHMDSTESPERSWEPESIANNSRWHGGVKSIW